MPRAPADSRVKARPVPLVARIGRNTGCVAGSETAVRTGADGVVDFVVIGSVTVVDDATIVTDVISPDNASRSFIPDTPEDYDTRRCRKANSFDDPAGREAGYP